ncbi:MAG: enoyl-CoA hydratase-related protein [Bacteroidota bacterium]
MNLFDKETIEKFQEQTFAFLEVEEKDNVLTVTLDRAAKKNALHPKMVHELGYSFQYAHSNKAIWMIVLQAKGNVFCAGADLKAFAGMAEENDSTIPAPNSEILLGTLFNKVHKPTIAKITGDVYAGGFFFLAGSTIVIAQDNVKFGLPEVKRGLYPFQVMAALIQVMPKRKVLDWCIRGYNLSVKKALEYGLITQMTSPETINEAVENVIAELKQNSPTAIRKGLEAFDHLNPSSEEHKYLLQMLMTTIGSKDGQEGLKAFREKRPPVWSGE